MRHLSASPAPSAPGQRPRRRGRRFAAGTAIAAGNVLALAALALPAAAAPGGQAAMASSRPRMLAVTRPAGVSAADTTHRPAAASVPLVTGGSPLPWPGGGLLLYEQAGGRRYTMAALARHAHWDMATGTKPAARAGRALATLRLKLTYLAGQPVSTVPVVLMNTGNGALDPAPVTVTGSGQTSVVPGDYSLFAFFGDVGSSGNPVAFHCVFLSDFRVGAGGSMVTIAESSATSLVSVATPRPVAGTILETTLFRGSKVGPATATGLILAPPELLPVYISPQPRARVGQLRYLSRWSGTSFSGRQVYDTAFAFPDIPRDEHFVVRQSQVATIHEHFYGDAVFPGQGVWTDDPCDAALLCGGYSNAAQRVPFFPDRGVDMPGNLTDYLDTSSGDQWMSAVFTPDNAFVISDPQTFLAGHSYSVDWMHGPLAAGFGQHRGPWQCQACTAGQTMSLNFSSLGDSDPSHFVLPVQDQKLQPHTRFILYRDGSRLASLSNATGDVVKIPAGTATYRAVLTVNMSHDAGFFQSSRSHTVLTVRNTPGAASALPAEDICAGQAAATPCRILPVLTLGYQLATNESNASNAATQVLHLQVGHLSYDGAGSHAAITSAAVWVSFDSGQTWQRAKVTGTAGQYTVTWPNPATEELGSPDIKVTATDAVGGSITQTITRAYTLASISHRARG